MVRTAYKKKDHVNPFQCSQDEPSKSVDTIGLASSSFHCLCIVAIYGTPVLRIDEGQIQNDLMEADSGP